jgi:cytochrome P450
MATISTPRYLLDQARRRLTPTMNTIPGMGALEERLHNVDWKQYKLVEPPRGSGLKPVMGDSGLPIIGHLIEMFRGGPDFPLYLYQTRGPVFFADSPILPSIIAVGPDATQAIFSNRNKDYSQKGWHPVIGPFFNRGLMMLDFDEHMYHRRIMQEAFTRTRLTGYVEHIDRVVTASVADWPTNDARFLFQPAMKELALDVASVVFMGHEPGIDHGLVT